jgi:pSer/pThr/pTyr-binding forkhead associated (FHA) protein
MEPVERDLVPERIVMTVVTGPHRDERFIFERKVRCMAGRAEDCLVRLHGEARDLHVSRHHCLLDIDPPYIWVSDLGSRNGTFINGQKVEPCSEDGRCPNVGDRASDCARAPLVSGDVLTIGGSSLTISVQGSTEMLEGELACAN